MVTAEQQKQASRKLNAWLENEKKIVTFRELSREVGCHVNAAKNLLLDHYESHTSLCPTYLLTGYLLSTSHLATNTLPDDFAQTSATQRVKIVDMDEMSDVDRNSEGEADDPDPDVPTTTATVGDDIERPDPKESGGEGGKAAGEGGFDSDALWGNDRGSGEAGISGKGVKTGLVEDKEGVVVAEEVKRWGVVLVQADALDEKKALFDSESLNIHIYALSPTPVKDPGQYLVSTLSLRSHPSYHKPEVYGTITGVSLRAVEESKSKDMKDGGMNWDGGKKEVKKEDKEMKKEVKKDITSTKDTPKAGPSKTADATPTAKAKEPAKTSQSSSAKTTKSKKRIITSDDEDDTAPAESAANPPSSNSKAKSKLEATSSQVRAGDSAAMEAMMGMDMDMDDEDLGMDVDARAHPKSDATEKGDGDAKVKVKKEKESPVKGSKAEKDGSAPSGTKRKRKVKRTDTVMNEKGYMVTTDRWSETSASGSDDEPEPSNKATAAKKKAAAATTANSSRASSASASASTPVDPRKGVAPKPAPRPSGGSGGGGAGGGGKKAGGQSTLAGFFKKKT